MVGRTLSHYQIVEKLGAGGMGEVYRARDTRLGREVAIKVLPQAFAQDPERLARLEREAQVLASLNHPNIAAIYGLEEWDGIRFLVLELAPGETPAGPLPIEEALGIGRQIAEALEAAHEKGIVHRDLKPANVKVTPEGKVKVLDFGLAKALGKEASAVELSHAPTATIEGSREGVILGTAAYMSPEQARGKPVDKRTDIWSFGCVLYELLAGRRAFGGETVSDTMAEILKNDPPWGALPETAPAKVRDLLRRCLQKDPRQRLHDIADARIEIEEAEGQAVLPAPAPAGGGRQARLPVPVWFLSGLMAAIAGVAVWSQLRAPRPPRRPPARVIAPLPPKVTVALGRGSAVAFSPDGLRVAYTANAGGSTLLYLRGLDQLEATPIPGTEGASNPFYSPDSQWIGFFASGKLKKVTVMGGAPITLCDAPNPRGESWGPDDTILFTPRGNSGLWRVSAAGGAPQVLTTLNQGELSHRWPQVLPGGKAVLFTIWNDTGWEDARIAVQSLETGERRVLVEGGGYARYASTGPGSARGHLVYARAGGLMAAPFDLQRLQLAGPAVPILEGVITNLSGGAHFSFSSDGSLSYLPGSMGEVERTLLWVDRKGAARPLAQIRAMSLFYRLSPDGRRLARSNSEGPNRNVWIYDLERGASTRLTFGANNHYPVWTPDGKRVTFSSGLPNTNLFWKFADGAGPEERLTSSAHSQFPGSWSLDGKWLAYTEYHPTQGWDIWVLPLAATSAEAPAGSRPAPRAGGLGEGKPQPFLQTPFSEGSAEFSPDGRWLAYQSNESGRFEVYVQPFPGSGRKWQISTEGGMEPAWAKNGREIFFRNGDRMMAVSVSPTNAGPHPEFQAQKPGMLFEGRYETNYDVARDGQRFLMMKGIEQESAPTQLNLVLNWFEDLKRRAGPAGK